MDAIYHLKPYELTDNFFNILKTTFWDKEITISVEEPTDTTGYLLSTEANRKHLLDGIESVKQGRCVHTMSLEDIESLTS
jgi:antitoxin YefM